MEIYFRLLCTISSKFSSVGCGAISVGQVRGPCRFPSSLPCTLTRLQLAVSNTGSSEVRVRKELCISWDLIV